MRRVLDYTAKAAIAAVLLGAIGVFGKFAGYPLLFASLGPTAALQVTAPQLQMSRPWNVVVGHLIGIAVGYAAVFATGAAHAPPFTSGEELTFVRVEAAALAMFAAILLELAFGASHAPAGATTLLVALGIMPPTWSAVTALAGGIALITVSGEGVRLLQSRGET